MDPWNIQNEYFGYSPMSMDLDQFLSFKMTSDPRLIIGDPRSRFISDPTNDPISDPTSDPNGLLVESPKKNMFEPTMKASFLF